MAMTDPIADYLTRIRNAILAKHEEVEIPSSKIKVRITEILKDEGYIEDYQLLDDRIQGRISIRLRWIGPKDSAIRSMKRESRPGRRLYVKSSEIPRVRNGHGVAIISTSKGVVSDRDARKLGVGGEYICSIY